MSIRARIIREERSTKTVIQVEPGSVPDLEMNGMWTGKRQVIRPDEVTIVFVNGTLTEIEVAGAKMTRWGRPSTHLRSCHRWFAQDPVGSIPEWVFDLPNQITIGRREWS